MPYKGPDLTVGRVGQARLQHCIGAGFRRRALALGFDRGLRLGEEVAIAVLEELRLTGNELFQGWSLRRFDGRRVRVR